MGAALLVDGHNLLLSGALRVSLDADGAGGREGLCAVLSSYARARGLRLTVVFDSPPGRSGGRSALPFKGGVAVYAAPHECADDVLRGLARGAGRGTIVVTNDRGLAGTLPSRNATVVSCGVFAERLENAMLESVKGSRGEDGGSRRKGTEKKGEGRRLKKRERRREDLLKKM